MIKFTFIIQYLRFDIHTCVFVRNICIAVMHLIHRHFSMSSIPPLRNPLTHLKNKGERFSFNDNGDDGAVVMIDFSVKIRFLMQSNLVENSHIYHEKKSVANTFILMLRILWSFKDI